jgi:hypothetical protein
MRFSLTLFTYQHPRGDTLEIDAASGTEASRLAHDELIRRAHVIKGQAARVVGWSVADRKRRRKDVLHQISWLHANVEEERNVSSIAVSVSRKSNR